MTDTQFKKDLSPFKFMDKIDVTMDEKKDFKLRLLKMNWNGMMNNTMQCTNTYT